MRVLFVTIPWTSHFNQMVPLAWALRSAGHEVRVASEPNFLDTITEAGLTAVPAGSDETLKQRVRRMLGGEATQGQVDSPFFDSLYEIDDGHRDGLPWEAITWVLNTLVVPQMWILNDEMVDDLVTYCRHWQPDLVLCDALTHAGAVAADAVGAAHARMLFGSDPYLRMRRDFLRAKERQPGECPDTMRDWYAEWARKYGRDFTEELVTSQFAVNVLPERCRLEPHERTLSLRYVPYNGHSVVPSWLYGAPRAPRVLVTFGITSWGWADRETISAEQVQEILDSLADLDIELVLTLPGEARELLRGVPENTRIEEFIPLDVILPTCAAVVHHGGGGSFNGAMLHGIPQLLLTYAADAPAKRTVLRQTGAGLSIAPDEVTGPRVRASLTRLLEDDAIRAGAERFQQETLAHPTPSALVPDLERLTAELRSPRAHG
ncbi:activator-dependent family glycosyltransferase [Saccharomonospora sp. NPDC046836]|uniref:activator-dependent family glycosyltransferase n=1 Tax=Saccharomonospora sp. NPDC046836 TaxID=3156921 RepID=UPI003408B63F